MIVPTDILEIATFQLLPQTDEKAFLQAAIDAGNALQSMPGFVNRRLLKSEDGGWIDLVEWTDRSSAQKAAESFHALPAAQPFCAMIDMATAKMTHHRVAI